MQEKYSGTIDGRSSDVRNNDVPTNYNYRNSLHSSINISHHLDNQHHSPTMLCQYYKAVCVTVGLSLWLCHTHKTCRMKIRCVF